MTESIAEAETTETEQPKNDVAEQQPKPKRQRKPKAESASAGRPRPTATLERDARALEFLISQKNDEGERVGVTRGALAEAISVSPSEAYLSVYRLGRDGYVEKSGAGVNTLWKISDDGVAYLEKYTQEAEAARQAQAAAADPNTPDENGDTDADAAAAFAGTPEE